MDLPIPDFHVNGIIYYVVFGNWLLSLNVSRFIHIAPCIRTSFLFMAEKYFTIFYPFVNWWTLGYEHLWAIRNNAAIKPGYEFLCGHVFIYLRPITIWWVNGNSMLNHLSNCQIVFQIGCTILYSYKQWMRICISSYSPQLLSPLLMQHGFCCCC